MAEPKRVDLTSVTPSAIEKKTSVNEPTLRFYLTLSETNGNECPEFFYSDLVKKAAGEKCEKNSVEDNEDHDKLVALAKSFDDKYAPKVGKSKRRDRLEDLVDLGEGYDVDDPFIDDGEAYDELVPANLTTKLGGFYINSGLLDFRDVSGNDSDHDFKISKKKRKVLTSDDEHLKKIKKHKLKDVMLKHKKRRMLSSSEGGSEKPLSKKMKFKDRNKIKSFLKKKKRNISVSDLFSPVEQNGHVTSSGDTSESSSQENNITLDPQLSAKIDSTINSVINAALVVPDLEETEVGRSTPTPPALPPDLPEELVANLDKIKQAAVVSEGNKLKFFTPLVNKILLDLETQSRQLQGAQRSVIYGHLAAYLPCSKDTLIKRAKKLAINEQDDKLRGPKQLLQDAINKEIPPQIEKFQAECQAFSLARKQENKTEEKDGLVKEDVAFSADSDEEEANQAAGEKDERTNPNAGEKGQGDRKRVTGPRKKFEWTEDIRRLLCDVVRIKMEWFDLSKGKSQTAEEYVKLFLDAEIKPLWPKGWAQTRQKPKKLMLPKTEIPKNVTDLTSSPLKLNKTNTENKLKPNILSKSNIQTGQSQLKPVVSKLDFADYRYNVVKGSTVDGSGVGNKAQGGTKPSTSRSVVTTNMSISEVMDMLGGKREGADKLLQSWGVSAPSQGNKAVITNVTPVTKVQTTTAKPSHDEYVKRLQQQVHKQQQLNQQQQEVHKQKQRLNQQQQPIQQHQPKQQQQHLKQQHRQQQPNKAAAVKSTAMVILGPNGDPKIVHTTTPQGQSSSIPPVNVGSVRTCTVPTTKINVVSVTTVARPTSANTPGNRVQVTGQGIAKSNIKYVARVSAHGSTASDSRPALPAGSTQGYSLLQSGRANSVTSSQSDRPAMQEHTIQSILSSQQTHNPVGVNSTQRGIVTKPRPTIGVVRHNAPHTQPGTTLQPRPQPKPAMSSVSMTAAQQMQLAELYAQAGMAEALGKHKAPSLNQPRPVYKVPVSLPPSPVISPTQSSIWNVLNTPSPSVPDSSPYSSSNQRSPPVGLPSGYQHLNANDLKTSPPRLSHLGLQRSPGHVVPMPGYISPVHHGGIHSTSPLSSPVRRTSSQNSFQGLQHPTSPYGATDPNQSPRYH